MDVVIVGSVALDTVEAPKGSVQRALGGAAVYASVAASYISKVGLVGVVGGDFPRQHIGSLRKRGIDLEGLEIVPDGRTFFWHGRYELDINYRTTLETQLNVFETFSPKLPESYRQRPFLLLGNIHPSLQLDVLRQVREPRLVLCDTMNLWIETERRSLLRLLRQVDVLCINDAEARQLTERMSIPAAAAWILERGPSRVIIKRGEHGCSLFSRDDGMFSVPAYPVAKPIDPTGAGDTFAGGFIGYLASRRRIDGAAMRQALVFGSVMASFCVENFSVGSLFRLKGATIAGRCNDFWRATQFRAFKFGKWKE